MVKQVCSAAIISPIPLREEWLIMQTASCCNAGPTACWKTITAISLAKALKTVILSADSRHFMLN